MTYQEEWKIYEEGEDVSKNEEGWVEESNLSGCNYGEAPGNLRAPGGEI